MNLHRRELKFQIPARLVQPISDYIAGFVELDHYSKIIPDHHYVINTLYFDTDAETLIERKRADMARRFSVRLRSYGRNSKFPAFFEIKHKVNQWIVKRRAPLTSQATIDFLATGKGDIDKLPDFKNKYLREIMYYLIAMDLKPRMMTQYERKAYFGIYEPYTRVTFDRRLRVYPETEYNIFADDSKFANYDHQFQYSHEDSEVVLELKCEAKVPEWYFAIIREFELDHKHFSKFESSWNYMHDFEAMTDDFDTAPAIGMIR
jgi:hypothetical protein